MINKDIFRAYDIRGIIGKEWCLDNDFNDAYRIGQAIGAQVVEQNPTQINYLSKSLSKNQVKNLEKNNNINTAEIVVGRDGRLSSKAIRDALIQGLLSVGCNVTDIGITATPTTFFSLAHLNINNSIMITGSHSPASTNGIKTVFDRKPITPQMIGSFYAAIQRGTFQSNSLKMSTHHKETSGTLSYYKNINDHYQQAIVDNIFLDRPLRIGIDAGNGATSPFAESLFKQLGCEVHPLFCQLDGTFPNHSPDPTKPENLEALIALVKKKKLDLGIAFDGDGDRFLAVDSDGNILWPDRIMILLAEDILKTNGNASIVFDVKCSYLLPQAIKEAGGKPSMCPTGHSMLKLQMLKLDSPFGGEYTGHIVFRDRWNDVDDGPYGAARLLEILSRKDKTSAEIFSKIPSSFTTPEFSLTLDNIYQCKQFVISFIQHSYFPDATFSTLDGLRVDFEDGWGLIRASNTGPSIGFRFEATSKHRLEEIQQQFRTILQSFDTLELPF